MSGTPKILPSLNGVAEESSKGRSSTSAASPDEPLAPAMATGRSSIAQPLRPAGLSARQARAYRRAIDTRIRWWHRLRAVAVLSTLVIMLGVTLAAFSGVAITVATRLVLRLMGG